MTPPIVPDGAFIMAAEPQLFISDMAASLRFFVNMLGFGLRFSHGEPAFYAQIGRGGARINLRQVEGPVLAGDFRVREADALSATLILADAGMLFAEYRARGVVFHQELRVEPWRAQTFIIADPDGNLIAFAGDDPPAP